MFREDREDSTEKPGFLPFSDKYRCQHPKQLLAALTIFAGCYWRGSLNIREQQRRVQHSSDNRVRHLQRKAARPKLLPNRDFASTPRPAALNLPPQEQLPPAIFLPKSAESGTRRCGYSRLGPPTTAKFPESSEFGHPKPALIPTAEKSRCTAAATHPKFEDREANSPTRRQLNQFFLKNLYFEIQNLMQNCERQKYLDRPPIPGLEPRSHSAASAATSGRSPAKHPYPLHKSPD